MTRLPTNRPPTHPGEMLLKEFIEPRELSLSAFARAIGVSFPRMHEIVRGKRPVTIDTALRLQRVLAMPAGFWMGLQLDWDLWHAQRSPEGERIQALEPLPPPACEQPVHSRAGRMMVRESGKRKPVTGGSRARKRTIKRAPRKART